MEDTLQRKIEDVILNETQTIYLFDALNDTLISYSYQDGKFVETKKEPLTEYLVNIKSIIAEDYISKYMSAISIPKLEDSIKDGVEKIVFNYKTVNNKSYCGTTTLLNINGNKAVLMLSKEEKENIVSDDKRYDVLLDNLSDAIIKVQNVFNLDEKKLDNISNVEEYINSVFNNLIGSYPDLKKKFSKTVANVSGREQDTILIVDDDKVMRTMIKKIFTDEYKLVEASNGKEAMEYLDTNSNKGMNESSDHVVSIFLDLTMPVVDGFAVLEYLSKRNYLNKIPVIIISGDYEQETRSRVYNYNIADMLEKPFDFEVVRHRISNFINLYKSSNSLNNLVNDQNDDLKDLINPFVDAYKTDYKDDIRRVSEYIKILGNQVMNDYDEYNLNASIIDKMADASTYYDIGFYKIPRSILNKKDTLTKEEVNEIKEYPLFGSKMISYVLSLMSDAEYKKLSDNITKHYHENYDGTGYPEGLKGDNIPIESQLAAIAITYNNLIKKHGNDVNDIILSKSGSMFNPKLVGSFMKVTNRFEEIR